MRKFLVFLVLVLFLLGCNKEKNQFFKLESVTYVDDFQVIEHVVMSNPHKNTDSLFVQVKDYMKVYNQQHHIDQKDILYTCSFYKETRNTPRDYEEDPNGYFSFDEIGHHGEDQIVVVDFNKNKGWNFIIIPDFNIPKKWKYYRDVPLK